MDVAAMYAQAALLAFLCFTTVICTCPTSSTKINKENVKAVDDAVYVYRYSAAVSAGQNDPVPFVSKFQIQGKLLIKLYNYSDPKVKYFKFHDIKHTIYNGPDEEESHGQYQVLEDDVKDFEEPILVIYDEYNKLQGIKIQEKEAIWSKNMKKSLASIMQIEFKQFELQENMKPTAFKTLEKTIHGDCQVDYTVDTKEQDCKKLYYVRKTYEPRSCQGYVQQIASDAKNMDCKVEMEEDLVTSVERIYEFVITEDKKFLINKIVTHEKLSYLPWLHRSSGIQHIITNQTFEFEKVINISEANLPDVDFEKISTENLVFNKTDYVPSGISEIENYFGRRTLNLNDLIEDVKELLIKIVNNLNENFIDIKKIDSNLLEKLHHKMTFLDTESLHYIYKHFNADSEKGSLSRNVFLKVVPHTGTHAAWNFTYNIIVNEEVPDVKTSVNMLSDLPLFILNPNEEFAKEMEKFSLFDQSTVDKAIKTSGILCYSILLHKTYKNIGKTVPEFLKTQLTSLNARLKCDPTYQGKIVLIMAMRNIEVGNIYQYLAPIIRGEDVFFVDVDIPKPEKYRVAAMWAVAKSISHNKDLMYNLFWPILSNTAEPLSLRLTAYELLISRNPMLDMNLLMNVYWLMSEEQNVHIYNYHYTTLTNMAESTDPCVKNISEMMRKVLRLTKRQKNISTSLSRVTVYDIYDNKYGYGNIFKMGVQINEASGIPQVGYYETISTYRRKPKIAKALYWNVDGVNLKTLKTFMQNLLQYEIGFVRNDQSFNEIQDENVKNLLRQTHGYKLWDKHVHVELWSMNKGYVTNVQVFFENGLFEFLKHYIDSYKPKNLMNLGDKFIFDYLDISYLNQYTMIVPTDMGIPAFFYNEVPFMWYMKLKSKNYPLKEIVMKLKFEFKSSRYLLNEMKFYNPFVDITQAIQRRVTTDAALPIDMTVYFNLETYNLKILLPRIPETKYSVAGIKVHSIDQVNINNDYKDVLKTHCPTCQHSVNVTKSLLNKKTYENVLHSMDTGLEFASSTFDCDASNEPDKENEEIYRVLNMEHNNDNNVLWPLMYQGLLHFINRPYQNNCGKIFKISPSTVYPTSYVEMNWRPIVKMTNNEIQFNIRGSVDTVSATTNKTMRYWDIDTKINASPFTKELTLKLMRRTPGEKYLKICFDALKRYPDFTNYSTTMKHETDSKISFMMGYSDDVNCVGNGAVAIAKIKGELLDEQVEEMKRNVEIGSCFKNPLNPLDIDYTKKFDWNCMYQLVKATTLRKYSVNITYEKIPHEILAKLAILDDYLRFDNFQRIIHKPNHTDVGNFKMFFTYSTKNNYANITLMNPFYSYELVDVLYGPNDAGDRQNDLILDNTVFSIDFLAHFYKGDIRPCIMHANDIINDLNHTVAMNFENWTLMSGDYEFMSYAIFAKVIDNHKVAVKMYVDKYVLEIQPGDSKPVMTLDGKEITNYDKGIVLPSAINENANLHYFKISMLNQLLIVELIKDQKVKIYYTPHNTIILPNLIFDRNIDGLCGHMGSMTYTQQVPLVYQNA